MVGARGPIAGAVGPPVEGGSARQGRGGGGPLLPVVGGGAGGTWPRVRALVQALGGRRRRRRGRAALDPLFGLDWWGFDSSARSCWAAPRGWRRRRRAVGSQAMRMIGFVDQGSRWTWSGGDSSSTASGPLLSCSVRVEPSCSQRTWWRLVAGRGVAGQGLGVRPMPLGLCLVRYLRALAVPRTTLLVNGCVVVVAAVVDGRVD